MPRMSRNMVSYPLKETIFFRMRAPNAIIPSSTPSIMWPLDEYQSGRM